MYWLHFLSITRCLWLIIVEKQQYSCPFWAFLLSSLVAGNTVLVTIESCGLGGKASGLAKWVKRDIFILCFQHLEGCLSAPKWEGIAFSETELVIQALFLFPVPLGVMTKPVNFLGYGIVFIETKVTSKYRILIAC